MAVNYTDFEKVWASDSPLTPYEFSDNNYRQGWNFVGATPPSRQMWDAFMKHADEKLKYLYDHEDIPVGHEYFTMNPNIPQGSLPLLGGEYSRETYSALWTWVQQQTGYLKTEAEWQTLSESNNGNVPYYSSGDGSTTFRVPSLHCWIKGSDGSAQLAGSYLEAGLPNITGSVDNIGSMEGIHYGLSLEDTQFNGAFYGDTTDLTNDFTISSTTPLNKKRVMEFNASRSSAIYGNANTVQTESIVGMWLVKAYGTIVDTGQIDEQQYIDDRMADLKNVYLPANYLSATDGNVLITRNVNVATNSNQQGYNITAPAVSGYQFVCWVMSATGGYVSASYIESAHLSNAKVWITNPADNHSVDCTALYIRKV